MSVFSYFLIKKTFSEKHLYLFEKTCIIIQNNKMKPELPVKLLL